MWFQGKTRGRQFARESQDEAPSGPVSKDLRRRVGRALEWHLTGQIAKKVPPSERLYLVYEVARPKGKSHPRVQRALDRHGRAQQWFGAFALVPVTHDELAYVVGSPEWVAKSVAKDAALADNEGRCVIVRDVEQEPEVLVFDARGAKRRENAG
jgi:hypothetical protein